MLKVPWSIRESLFFVCLWVLELSLLVILIAVNKKGNTPLFAFLHGSSGILFVAGIGVLFMAAIGILILAANGWESRTKSMIATLAMNLCSLAAVLAVAEVFIRVFSVNTPQGPEFAGTLLLPRKWEQNAARYRAILAKASAQGSYLVYDSELGWTIGRNRRSKDYNRDLAEQLLLQRRRSYPENYPVASRQASKDDDIYFSSVEGIRSPRVGMTFTSPRPKYRIAIIGDSFTFGLEVRYEDTWGHQLERILGPDYQVLNFGVDGYGIDQAYLRYQKHVLPWRPDIVIFGFVNHDFRRTMCVYAFLCFPGGEIPFPKPRFVVNGDGLTLLNLPLPTPDSVFAKRSIADLPYVNYDVAFEPNEWEWAFYGYSDSIRFLLSRFPRWPVARPIVSDEELRAVNGRLLRSFFRLAQGQGSKPILVFFPSTADLGTESTLRLGVAREVLQANGIPYFDMTACVKKVSPSERFVTLHYSATTNAAVANCLRESLREALG